MIIHIPNNALTSVLKALFCAAVLGLLGQIALDLNMLKRIDYTLLQALASGDDDKPSGFITKK